MPDQDAVAAHEHSSRHEAEIRASERCGCFYCRASFLSAAIEEWIDEPQGGRNALCPKCGVDAVIGWASGHPITAEFLARMKACWF